MIIILVAGHLWRANALKIKALEQLIDEPYWIFNKKGNIVKASNDAFSSFDDFIARFEKCFHVYGEQKDIIKKLTSFTPVDVLVQKKGDQSFYHCIFKPVGGHFVFYLRAAMSPSTQPVSACHESDSTFEFVEMAPVGFIFFDKSHNIGFFNKSAERFCNVSLSGKKITEIIPTAVPGFHSFRCDLYMHISAFDEETFLCTIIDGKTQFDISRIPSVRINQEGEILQYNQAFTDALKKFEIEAQDNFFDLLDKSRRFEIKNKYERCHDTHNTPDPFEAYFLNQNLITTVYTSRDNRSFLLQLIDISEQKQLEQQFIQSQKMQAVGQLAGGIAHDFNNILTAIIGFTDLLLQKYLPNDPSYGDLVQIKQNANRATNLVRQLLAFSRQQKLQPTVLNVGDVLSELSALLHRLLGAKIDLQVTHGKNIWAVKTDLSQLEQVIINLAVNARDAMGYAGQLMITTDNYENPKDIRISHDTMPKGRYVTISVRDNGCGISAEHLPHIFEPFFTTKKVGSGTGLGLSTVYGIVKQTGGFITVQSESRRGTIFTIYLPAVDDEIVITPVLRKNIMDLTGKEKILLVEDEDAVRHFTARALREKGYDVVEAVSGKDALARIQEGVVFDLIVSDIVMPEIDGPTFIKEVRFKKPDTKAIFISGYSDENFNYNFSNDNLTFFLPKPFTIKDLALKVRTSLQARAS